MRKRLLDAKRECAGTIQAGAQRDTICKLLDANLANTHMIRARTSSDVHTPKLQRYSLRSVQTTPKRKREHVAQASVDDAALKQRQAFRAQLPHVARVFSGNRIPAWHSEPTQRKRRRDVWRSTHELALRAMRTLLAITPHDAIGCEAVLHGQTTTRMHFPLSPVRIVDGRHAMIVDRAQFAPTVVDELDASVFVQFTGIFELGAADDISDAVFCFAPNAIASVVRACDVGVVREIALRNGEHASMSLGGSGVELFASVYTSSVTTSCGDDDSRVRFSFRPPARAALTAHVSIYVEASYACTALLNTLARRTVNAHRLKNGRGATTRNMPPPSLALHICLAQLCVVNLTAAVHATTEFAFLDFLFACEMLALPLYRGDDGDERQLNAVVRRLHDSTLTPTQ